MSKNTFTCPICMEFNTASTSRQDDWFVTTPGGHVFHYLCVTKVIQSGDGNCPLCREKLTLTSLTRLYNFNPSEVNGNVNPSEPDHKLKIILLGDTTVGKSSLAIQFANGVFYPHLIQTVGCDMFRKTIKVGEKSVEFVIWDTAGQDRFQTITKNYIRGTDGVIYVYDVTRPSSFHSIHKWNRFIEEGNLPDVVKVLVGNKTDLAGNARAITVDQGIELSKSLGENITFLETSAKDKDNVEAAFRCLVGEIISKNYPSKKVEGAFCISSTVAPSPNGTNNNGSGGCC